MAVKVVTASKISLCVGYVGRIAGLGKHLHATPERPGSIRQRAAQNRER